MSVWLIRAGKHGEHEAKFIEENRVYVTWDNLSIDLSKVATREALMEELGTLYSESKPKRISNWSSQLWPFAHSIKKGDLVVLPLKTQQNIYIGEITGNYQFSSNGPNPFYHWRSVKWVGEAIPRQKFGQDLLHSMGAFLTICSIHRNDAEARIRAMRASGWKDDPHKKGGLMKSKGLAAADIGAEEMADIGFTDLEQEGLDRIAALMQAKFSGHGLTRVVEGILKAQGYTTYRSPESADGGVDILAGMGTLGFGSPQLCVEVKSQDTPVDRETVDKLLGAMSKFQAPQGLFVSWGGFKTNVQKELAQSFFKVRLWSQLDLLEALFANYDMLDDDLKAELPLKRIWTVALPEGD